MQTIFISIASYCDSLLSFTIKEALSKATFPERLRFGVVEQQIVEDRLHIEEHLVDVIRYVGISPKESRGACWARAIAMSLYDDEDFFFQIDSHMLFDKGWDVRFINDIYKVLEISSKPIISSYPSGFEMQGNTPVRTPLTVGVLAHTVPAAFAFEKDHLVLCHQAAITDTKEILNGFHLGAGCLFTLGLFVYEIPYDPFFYFAGEEQALALRAYTHGWDIFHAPDMPIYHLYDLGNENFYRKKHWAEEEDKKRKTRWWDLDRKAKARFQKLIDRDKQMGAFGLGDERSVQDFANFCGIDYINKTVGQKARTGPWIDLDFNSLMDEFTLDA